MMGDGDHNDNVDGPDDYKYDVDAVDDDDNRDVSYDDDHGRNEALHKNVICNSTSLNFKYMPYYQRRC